ncbi:MAG TPA: OFA family MFS transporter [Halococcus sp.]|nr:OFA family MFS transporter [Halococcus sp.]
MRGSSDGGVDFATRAREELGFSRWWQLVAAAVMMGLVGPYKYIWSSIQRPLATKLGISLPALGFVFTLYVFFQVGTQFPAGWYRDRFGPRLVTLLAGVLAGGGYIGLAYATQLWQIYVLYSLGSIGVGIVYMVAVNTALKWFPDRRGFATGLGTMAFATGSVAFIPYVRANATVGAVASVLQNVGVLVGVGILAGAVILRDPPADWPEGEDTDGNTETDPSTAEDSGTRQYTWREALNTWQFRVLLGVFVGIAAANLMLAANLVPFAVNAGMGPAVVTTAAAILPVADGLGRLSSGSLSDRIGRKRTMIATFSLCGIGLVSLTVAGAVGSSVIFLGAVVLATFFEGTQYSLLPSVVADYYGQQNSSTNYAALYTVQIASGVFAGVGVGWLVTVVGWSPTFLIGGGLALAAGIGVISLRPPA